MDDEYEIIPVSPLRKLEKRIDDLEKAGVEAETIRELVDIVRSNQRVVDEIVKVNSDMMSKVSVLAASVNNLSERVSDFMGRIELAGENEPAQGEPKEYAYREPAERHEGSDARLVKLEKRVNALILALSKAKMRHQNPGIINK